MQEEESLYLTISPRDERRLLREKSAKRTLGRAISGLSSGAKKLKDVPFDPTAEDGDGDGKVQDNTRWARPATPGIPDALDSDYRGQHSAPGKDDGAPLHDLTKVYPEDVYSATGRKIYATGEDRIDSQAFELISELRGKPNALVTVYRAVPISSLKRIDELEKQKRYILKNGAIPPGVRTPIDDSSEYYDMISEELEQLKGKTEGNRFSINRGDWVTPFRSYAVEHGQSNLGGAGKYEIVKRKVRARDIYTAGDSWAEWGYDPEEEEVQRGLASGKKDKNQKQKVTPKESPRLYTMWEYMNDKRNKGEDINDEEDFAAQNIDGLVEHVLSRLTGGKITPIVEDYEIFETLGIALEVDLSNLSPEIALQKALDAFNKKFGTNHKKTSLIIGAINSSGGLLDTDDVKKVIQSVDEDELKKIHRSMDYKYGDINLLTGEVIQYNGPGWLHGLTPKQISMVVTPEKEEDLLEIVIDFSFGRDMVDAILDLKNRQSNGESLTQESIDLIDLFDKTTAKFSLQLLADVFSAENLSKLRKSIESALSKSPLFYEVVQIVGFPPISGLEKPGFHTDRNPNMAARTHGIYFNASNRIGIHNLLIKLAVDKEPQWEKDMGVHEIIKGAPVGSNNKSPFQGDALVDTIIHEWGHYLWFTLVRGFGVTPSELDSSVASTELSRNILSKLSKKQQDELLRFLKLFDYGEDADIFSTFTNGGGYFDKSKGFSSRSPIEIMERQKLQRDGKSFSSRIEQAMEKYSNASGLSEKKQALAALDLVIGDIINSTDIFASSKYGASMPQEAFAELIKDYLSPAYSDSRQDLISQGSIDMLDLIFGLIKTIGGN